MITAKLLLPWLLLQSSLGFSPCFQPRLAETTSLRYGKKGDETSRDGLVQTEQPEAAVSKMKQEKKSQHEILDMCSNVLEDKLDDYLQLIAEHDYDYTMPEDAAMPRNKTPFFANKKVGKKSHHEVLEMCSSILEDKLDEFLLAEKDATIESRSVPFDPKARDLSMHLRQRVPSWNSRGYRPDMVVNLKQECVRESRNGAFEGDRPFVMKANVEDVIESLMKFPPVRALDETSTQ